MTDRKFEEISAEQWEESADILEKQYQDDPVKNHYLKYKPETFRDYARTARERLANHTIFHHPV